MLKIIDSNCDSGEQFMPDGQYHNRIRVRTCSVKIQKLPNRFGILAKRMKKQTFHEGNKPYICNVCDKVFSYKQYLNKHIESAHEGKKPFNCNVCNEVFSEKGHLNQHIES